MCTNGAGIGMAATSIPGWKQGITHGVPNQVPIGFCAVVRGTVSIRTTFARRIAATTIRGAGTTASVSGCPRAISLFSFSFLLFMARSASKIFILALVSVRFRTILSGFARWFVEQ